MAKILSVKQLYEADTLTVKNNGITALDLMEHAASLCFHWIDGRLHGDPVPMHVFCGTGNNGGDGLVIARLLHVHGYHVKTYVINCGNKRSESFLANYERLKEVGVWAEMITCKSEFPKVTKDDMIIDAIFGLGLTRSPENVLKETIQFINASNAYVLSIDFPSGLFAEKALIDTEAVVKAYHTLTFQTPKLAFLLPETATYVGTWDVLDIGLDAVYMETVETKYHINYKNDIKPLYKFREPFSHKGDYGHALLIGGSFGKIGAVALATRAALVIGSGLVTAYVPKCGYQILQTSLPEAMVEVDEENSLHYFNYKSKPNSIGVGIGMGTDTKTAEGFAKFLKENTLPLVVDADAINLLAKDKKLLKLLPEGSILTPHPKEFERLVGTWKNDFDKLNKLLKFSKRYKLIVILKGAYSAIAHQEKLYFNSTGTPALATAGSGDVLTGILTGLQAQGYTPLDASELGVFLHGLTANISIKEQVFETFIASDIIAYLPDAFKSLLQKDMPKPQKDKDENEKKK